MIRLFKLAVIGLAAGLLVPPTPAAAQRTEYPGFSRSEFERTFRTASGGVVLQALERNFPDEAAALMDRMYELAYRNRSDPAAARGAAADEMMAVFRARVPDLRNAPASALREVFRRKLALYRRLESDDVTLCARLSVGTPGVAVLLPDQYAALASQVSIAMIDAAGAGRRAGPVAGRETFNQADVLAWAEELRRLDGDGQVMALLSGGPQALMSAAPLLQCRVAILSAEAALAMQEQPSGNAAAYLLLFELGVETPTPAS